MQGPGHRHFFPEVDFGRDDVPEFDRLMAALQEEGRRVVPVRYLGGTAWLMVRYEDVLRAFRDARHFPAAAAHSRYALTVQGGTLLCMEGEEQRMQRALVFAAFAPE